MRVEVQRTGQEVDAEVAPGAGAEQVLHLLVGLVPGDRDRDVDHGKPRRGDAEPAGQLADEHLGDQHLAALPRAA